MKKAAGAVSGAMRFGAQVRRATVIKIKSGLKKDRHSTRGVLSTGSLTKSSPALEFNPGHITEEEGTAISMVSMTQSLPELPQQDGLGDIVLEADPAASVKRGGGGLHMVQRQDTLTSSQASSTV
jgi:hypothetical protein